MPCKGGASCWYCKAVPTVSCKIVETPSPRTHSWIINISLTHSATACFPYSPPPLFFFTQYCVVVANIHTFSMDGHWKFWGGRGSQRPKLVKESMKLNWNFRRGRGVESEKRSMGEVWIFSGTCTTMYHTFWTWCRLQSNIERGGG